MSNYHEAGRRIENVHRETSSSEPIISDLEGPFLADKSFKGCLYIHMDREAIPRASSLAEVDEFLAPSLERLIERHPGRKVRFVQWDTAMEGTPKLAKIIAENDIQIIYFMWKHSELAQACLTWMIALNRKR